MISSRLSGQLTFFKTLGGTNIEVATDIEALPQGGYIVSGYTTSYTSGIADFFLAKLNPIGDTIWVKVLGGTASDLANGVEISPDGNYWMVGSTISYSFGNYDHMVVRTDTNGSAQYWREIGGTGADHAHSLVFDQNGSYTIGGWGTTFGQGGADFTLARFDGSNTLRFSKTYGLAATETLQEMIQGVDGSFIMSGYSYSFGMGSQDVYLVKTDTLGNIKWTKAYGTPADDDARAVRELPNGDLIIAGQTVSFVDFSQNMLLIRTDSLGDTIWCKSYGGAFDDYAESIEVLPDGGFIMVGGTGNGFSQDAFVIRLDSAGDTLWTRRYGGTGYDYLNKMIPTGAGDFIGVGASYSAASNSDAFFLRLDSLGDAGCQQIAYPVFIENPQIIMDTGGVASTGYLSQTLQPVERNGPFTQTKICESCNEPTSDFSFSIANMDVSFTENCFNATYLLWDFGDGTTSSQPDPVHTYPGPNTYHACLIAFNSCGRDTVCMDVNVTCPPAPIANFGHSENQLTIELSDSSQNATSWSWNFGDGNSGTAQNPTHTYGTPGSYNVCLTVSNLCGDHVDCEFVSLNCPSPTSDFIYSANNYTLTFTNLTNQAGAIYEWDFGDGTVSFQEHPVHTFPGYGSYDVCLTTYYCGWSDNFCLPIIVDCPEPIAAFSDSVVGTSGTVYFTDISSPAALTWSWDFGDGAISSLQNPVHTYFGPSSIFDICLIVTNTCGVDTICDSLNLVISGTEDPFTSGGFYLWPNPNLGDFSIELPPGLSGESIAEIYTPTGQVIYSEKFLLHPGNGRKNFSGIHLPSGVYMMRVSAKDQLLNQKFIVE